MSQTVIIDCFPESVRRYREGYAVVGIDVIRATTTAVTCVALGRRCFPVPSIEVALPVAARLDYALLIGELGGNMPYGFDLTNSPAELAARTDVLRPAILLSSSGTKLMYDGAACDALYVASLRNHSATAAQIAGKHDRVAVIGAGTRGVFREEDQACCALIAGALMQRGYAPENEETEQIVARWRKEPADAWLASASVDYLRRTGQLRDLAFIQEHLDDLPIAFVMKHGEVVRVPIEDR